MMLGASSSWRNDISCGQISTNMSRKRKTQELLGGRGGDAGVEPAASLAGGKKAAASRSGALAGIDIDALLPLKGSMDLNQFERCLTLIFEKAKRVDDRAVACYELALLYCQLGNFPAADFFLSKLGFKYRLNRSIWRHSDRSAVPMRDSSGLPGLCVCYDNVLPTPLLHRLQRVFAKDSVFWTEHSYPAPNFFSYNQPLGSLEHGSRGESLNLMQQLAHFLKPIVVKSFPSLPVETASSIEWWAHTRSNGPSAGHRLHFDLDEISLRENGNLSPLIHPFVSTVIYLDDGGDSGAPTLVTNQSILQSDGVVTDEACWLCPPKTNRMLLFEGSMLHGVVPNIRIEQEQTLNNARVTLMIGWWNSQVATTASPVPDRMAGTGDIVLRNLSPNMAMPFCDQPSSINKKRKQNKSSHKQNNLNLLWPSLFSCDTVLSNILSTRVQHTATALVPSSTLIYVKESIWDSIDDVSVSDRYGKNPGLKKNNMQFLGNWFIKSKTEILDEVVASCEQNKISASHSAICYISAKELEQLRSAVC